MTGYLLLAIAATAASLVAVWIYRSVFQRKLFNQKVVVLSNGSGNLKPQHQRGFVRPDTRTSRRRTARDKGPIRKPWGW